MTRRKFITLLGGAAVVSWPARPRAEQRSKRLIGLLGGASPASSTPQIQAWVGGLRELGYLEGQDYEIVAKWAFGVMDRLPALAEELSHPDWHDLQRGQGDLRASRKRPLDDLSWL